MGILLPTGPLQQGKVMFMPSPLPDDCTTMKRRGMLIPADYPLSIVCSRGKKRGICPQKAFNHLRFAYLIGESETVILKCGNS
jgi:hypothetical protein